ncbi:MAG: peptidoglycan editing factor PgeF [Lachnospiraceae bacterium]|nr:peptidoglycan editing factor PgeF [Lachnospiraceae bacterium]
MNSITTLNKVDGVEFLTYKELEKISFIKHAFSTKNGGVSEGIYKSMNLSYTRGDNKENVDENYRRFFSAIGCTLENVALTDQIHKTDIIKVDEEKLHELNEKASIKGKKIEGRKFDNIDGLITNLKNVPLVTSYADCVPLYFVDKKNKAIGLSHSGWRGTVAGMGIKTIEAMKEAYGTNPDDVVAVVGPSICKDCYEVSKEVVDEFHIMYDGKFDVTSIYTITSNDKRQLDLWEANKNILLLAGIRLENIIISSVCTSCNDDLLFSHRKTQGKRGNLIAVLEIV